MCPTHAGVCCTMACCAALSCAMARAISSSACCWGGHARTALSRVQFHGSGARETCRDPRPRSRARRDYGDVRSIMEAQNNKPRKTNPQRKSRRRTDDQLLLVLPANLRPPGRPKSRSLRQSRAAAAGRRWSRRFRLACSDAGLRVLRSVRRSSALPDGSRSRRPACSLSLPCF